MKKMKPIAIAHTRDFTEKTSLAIQRRVDVLDAGDTAQVSAVELEAAKEDGRHCESGNPGARVLVVIPVLDVQRVIPANAFSSLAVGVRGRPRLPWPWHFAVGGFVML